MENLVGVVIPLNREASPFLQRINSSQNKRIFYGNYNNTDFFGIISGYGKINAASATQYLIDLNLELDYILHFGSAGGIDSSLEIGEIIIPEKIIEYDIQMNFSSEKTRNHEITLDNKHINKFVSKLNPKRGTILSGDKEVANLETRNKLYRDYNALSADWESFAVAKVCQINQIPCVVLRTISDNADDSAVDSFYKNIHKVSKNLVDKILEIYS